MRHDLAVRGHHGPVEMVTERLVLRRWDPREDADVAAAYDLFSREEVARWRLPASACASTDEATEWLGAWQREAQDQPDYGRWAVTRHQERVPIGSVKLAALRDDEGVETEEIEIGWHLHPDHWGHGYATEAAERLLEHAWQLPLDEVVALTAPQNERSQALAQRLDMAYQGLQTRWGVQWQWWLLGAPLPPAA